MRSFCCCYSTSLTFSLNSALTWASVGAAGAIILVDVVSTAIRGCSKRDRPPVVIDPIKREEIRQQILAAKGLKLLPRPDRGAENKASPPILEQLCLGDSQLFAQTSGLTVTTLNTQTGRETTLATNNINNFKAVVTACPISDLQCIHTTLTYETAISEEVLTDALKKLDIGWLYVGGQVSDEPSDWESLIRGCTFSPDLLLEDNKMVEKWFGPVFAIFDRAVFKGERTLVHCQAGRSRSVSILAAYLINRFDVTAEEAVQYIATKRYIAPKFIEGLKAYELTLKKERFRIQILAAESLAPPSREARRLAQDTACHPILNQLYLGDSQAFVQTTTLKATILNETLAPVSLPTNNVNKFKVAITACPINKLQGVHTKMSIEEPVSEERLTALLKASNVEWKYVGRELEDDPKDWERLVQNCTFPEGKQDALIVGSVTDWFKPIFEIFDQAVFKEERALVHCQAGISRSTTILAAYLINRFDVTAEQAVKYIASRRTCINIEEVQFMEGLQIYEKQLRDARLAEIHEEVGEGKGDEEKKGED